MPLRLLSWAGLGSAFAGAAGFSDSGGAARAPGTDAKLKSRIASAASVPSFARNALTFPLSSG